MSSRISGSASLSSSSSASISNSNAFFSSGGTGLIFEVSYVWNCFIRVSTLRNDFQKGLLVLEFVELLEFVPADLPRGSPSLCEICRSFLMEEVCRMSAVAHHGCFLHDVIALALHFLQLVRMSCHRSIVDFNIIHDVITSFHESVGPILFVVPLRLHINCFVCVE